MLKVARGGAKRTGTIADGDQTAAAGLSAIAT